MALDTATRPAPADRGRWLPPAVLVVVVVLFALVPLLRTPWFYFWDDSAAAFLPAWRAIGLDLLSGTWPTLRPDFWMGGNWAVEAQFGLWNPVNLLVSVLVASLPDLAVAATMVKVAFMVLLAIGAYVLAREYGATPWVSSAVASALPFAGFTLFYDASGWVAGLMAFAWTPWFWWAARRCARDALNPGVVFALGYLLVTNGSPYGALAAVFVLAGVAVEAVATDNRAALGRLVVVGACVGATAGVAFLPLALSADAGWREASGLSNDGVFVPDLSMLAATSTPSMRPFIRLWGWSGTTVPMTYSAWFVVPLLPWLAWDVLRRRAREMTGVAVVLAISLALTLGPSTLWLFRWPVRLVEYAFLAAFLALAVVLSAGLRTSAWRTRAAVTVFLVGVGTWLAFAARPGLAVNHLIGTALVLALVAALIAVALRRPRALPAVLMAGTGMVLFVQSGWSTANWDGHIWDFPTSVADLDAYAERYDAPVVQVAEILVVPPEERRAAGRDLLFGNMPGAAGVESTTSYTGIGHTAFAASLCMSFAGQTCPEAFAAAWAPAGDAAPVDRLVDALKANTVVVQNVLVPDVSLVAPPGWELAEASDRVTVFRRLGDLPWPGSRLATATAGVDVLAAEGTRTRESVRVSTGPDGGALQFSRLAWPGYSATLDGRALGVRENSQGLIEVILPPDLDGARVMLEFAVPGYGVAVPALLLALAAAAAQAAVWSRRRGPARHAPEHNTAPTRQYAPEPLTTALIVRHRMRMSPITDQFST